MNTRRTILLLPLLLLLTLPARGQADGPYSFDYPAAADHLLLHVHRTWSVERCGEVVETGVETYRVFGDGRFEISPVPRWLEGEEMVLAPEFVEHLLHSVDALLDLGAYHLAKVEEDAGSFVKVRMDRYTTPEHAIYYLDAAAVSDLDDVFEELGTLKRWLAFQPAQDGRLRGIWFSGNPWPPPCQEKYRLRLGHRVLKPAWCSPPAFHPFVRVEDTGKGPFDGDDEARRAVRERLRERLRSLPRGLQDASASESASRCGSGHAHVLELAPKED